VPQIYEFESIKTKLVEIVDEQGKTRITLGKIPKYNGYGIILYDSSGKDKVYFNLNSKDHFTFYLLNNHDDLKLTIMSDFEKITCLSIYGDNGLISISSIKGNMCISINLLKYHQEEKKIYIPCLLIKLLFNGLFPIIEIYDQKGNLVFKVP